MKRRLEIAWSLLKDWTWLALSLASGAPSVILALWYLRTGQEPPHNALMALLVLCSIVTAWIGSWQDRKRIRLYENQQRPLLKILPDDFFQSGGSKQVRIEGRILNIANSDFTSLVVRIKNDPLRVGPNARAEEVTPELTFFDEKGTVLFTMEGRWSDSTQPSQLTGGTIAERKPITIFIQKSRLLDLVIKHNKETDCYAVNDESFEFDLRKPNWRMGPGQYSIRLALRGPNVEQYFQLKSLNPEGNGALEALGYEEITATKSHVDQR